MFLGRRPRAADRLHQPRGRSETSALARFRTQRPNRILRRLYGPIIMARRRLERAVRFPDGIVLLQGRILMRWLPDVSLVEGTAQQATELVQSKLPLKTISASGRSKVSTANILPARD
jgi:hypothetical protein